MPSEIPVESEAIPGSNAIIERLKSFKLEISCNLLEQLEAVKEDIKLLARRVDAGDFLTDKPRKPQTEDEENHK